MTFRSLFYHCRCYLALLEKVNVIEMVVAPKLALYTAAAFFSSKFVSFFLDVTALNAGKHCCFTSSSLVTPKKCFFVFVKPPSKQADGHLSGVFVALIVIGILIVVIVAVVIVGKKLQALRRKKYGLLNEPVSHTYVTHWRSHGGLALFVW